MRSSLGWLLLAAIAGCNSGESREGKACGPNGECPTDFVCEPKTHLCVKSSGGSIDAALADASAGGTPDAAAPDVPLAADAATAGPDAPAAPSDASPPAADASPPAADASPPAADASSPAVDAAPSSMDAAGIPPFVLTDGTFDPASWTPQHVNAVCDATMDESQQPAGGNPGAYRSTVITVSGLGDCYEDIVDIFAMSYDPAALGPVSSLSFSADVQWTQPMRFTRRAFVIVQGSATYVTGIREDVEPNATGWTVQSATFHPGGVTLLTGSGPAVPDLSAKGGPLRFGFYVQACPGCPGTDLVHTGENRLDNFKVEVYR
jgi:hypothetical protein